jgi:hypothetical protein
MVFIAKVPTVRVKEILNSALKAKSVDKIVQLTPEDVFRLAYEVLEGRPKNNANQEQPEPTKSTDPRIVAAIKDRESRTDRYGDDLVFQVEGDLIDRSYVKRWMSDHTEGCDLFRVLAEDERFRILREVLDEPEPGRGYPP